MQKLITLLRHYLETHPFDSGDLDCATVLDQLYRAYAESHEADPPQITEGFKELDAYLETLPLDDNNAVWNLCCRLCTAYEHKAFIDGFHYLFVGDESPECFVVKRDFVHMRII